MIKGSCLCGKVKFEISGEPSSLSYCHCSRCRKAAGVFSAVLVGKSDDLRVTEGQRHRPWTMIPESGQPFISIQHRSLTGIKLTMI
jgi:hypothetical protein